MMHIVCSLIQAMQDAQGLPVGVQCVALPYMEELCLRVMNDVETGLKNIQA